MSSSDINSPTEVMHVLHVILSHFNGFLSWPTELEPHDPKMVLIVSASVFGVYAKSMQYSYHERKGVPAILLMMQIFVCKRRP